MLFRSEGCFTHRHRELVFVVIKLTQLAKVRSIVREIDPSAFMIISDVNDVFGRGFTLKPSGPNFPRPKFPEKHEQEFALFPCPIVCRGFSLSKITKIFLS